MIKHETNGIVYYTFNNLTKAAGVRHLFSTRLGGVSTGEFESMNLSFTRGDGEGNVTENFKRIAEIGFPVGKMVFSNQTHDTRIRRVWGDDCGKGITAESDIVGVDGLVTNEPGVVLVTFYADCVPLYFFDTVKRVIALSHAGWRGTLMEMGAKTVAEMTKEFGSNPSDILVGIGPSICGDCFEVGGEIAEAFRRDLDFADAFIKSSTTDSNKSYIDLWGVNKQSLVGAGVPAGNIELPNLCTKCNPNIFYSHRAMGNARGSMAAFLSIND